MSARPLFVLSHMRSYSTVLCHVLGSHPEIDGYCETHIKYRTRLDLLRLRWRVRRLTLARLGGRYLLDKILHDYPLSPAILCDGGTRAIFLLRRPAETLRSVLEMGRRLKLVAWHQDPAAVARYYETRLATLIDVAARLDGRALLVESERLAATPAPELGRITNFLGLRQTLQQNYRHFPQTGKPGFGDPFEIGAGHALEARPERRSPLPIPGEQLRKLEDAYAYAVETVGLRCVPRV